MNKDSKGTAITLKGVSDDVMLHLNKVQLERKAQGDKITKVEIIKEILEEAASK
jgi:hypothetical protein